MLRRIWHQYGYTIRWIISIALLAVVVSRVDIQVVSGLFDRVDWWYYPLGVLLALLSNVFATKRWHLFVPTLTYSSLYRVNLISNYYAFLSGTTVVADLLKLGHISDLGPRRGEVLTSMIVDKALALVGSSVTLVLAAFIVDQTLPDGLLMSTVLFSGLCAGLLVLVVSTAARSVFESLVAGLSLRYRFVADRQDSLARTLGQVRCMLSSRSRISSALFYTLLFNLTLATIYGLWSFLFPMPLSPGSYIVVCIWAQIATMIPLGIAGLGIRDVTTAALLVSLGVEESTAAIAILSFYPLVMLIAALGFVLSITPNNQNGEKHNASA